MNRLHQLAIATIIVATPSFASAQGKAQGKAPHGPPPVMGKSAPVRQDNRPEKIADKQQRTAERNADKTERSELKSAHEQKLLTNGIRLTSAEKKQLKAAARPTQSAASPRLVSSGRTCPAAVSVAADARTSRTNVLCRMRRDSSGTMSRLLPAAAEQ